MSLPLTITLAGEPTGKGRARSRFIQPKGKAGFISTYTPEKTRDYETNLRIEAQHRMAAAEMAAPYPGAIEVEVIARFSIAPSWSKKKQEAARAGTLRPTKAPDADNLLKSLDALNKVVWLDDKQIVSAKVTKVYAEAPCLIVTVRAA